MLFILTTVLSTFGFSFCFCCGSVILCLYHSRINLCLYSFSFGVFFVLFSNLPPPLFLSMFVIVVVVVVVVVTASAVTVAIGSAHTQGELAISLS